MTAHLLKVLLRCWMSNQEQFYDEKDGENSIDALINIIPLNHVKISDMARQCSGHVFWQIIKLVINDSYVVR